MTLGEIQAAEQVGFPLVGALIALPMLLVALLALIRDERWVFRIGAVGASVEVLLAGLVLAVFRRGVPDIQLVERVRLGEVLSYHVGVDGLSVLFLPLTALLTLLVVLYSQEVSKSDPRRYLMAVFSLTSALMGAFAALDLVLFWIFAAVELVPGALLIRGWGTGANRTMAARRYLIFNGAGSLLMLAGLAVLALGAGSDATLSPGGSSALDLMRLLRVPIPPKEQALGFFLLLLAFAVRVPLFPFHGWLAVVMEEGPIVGVSVFLVGVKLGGYGLLRFTIMLLPEAARELGWIAVALGLTGMVYGALLALIQTNLRRFLAFACLSHSGGIMVGLFSLNTAGIEGGLIEMLNTGVAAAGLFFVAGFVHRRVGSSELSKLGGLSQRLPILSLTFLIFSLALIGMPGTSGFDAEHLILEGALDDHHTTLAIAVAAGSVLAAAYLFRYYQRAFLSSPKTPAPAILLDLRRRELLIAAVFGAILVGFGLFSRPIAGTVIGSVKLVAERIGQAHGEVPSLIVRIHADDPPKDAHE
jgi:NADH-quinone oxidoreductase subunit M